MSTDSETSISRGFLGNHTYSCALPVRGGVCNCQSDHDPTSDQSPYLSAARKAQQLLSGPSLQLRGGLDAMPLDMTA